MLYEDAYEFFVAMRRKSGKKTVCNFEVKGIHGDEVIQYGIEHFKGDWSYRRIDDGHSYCIYVNTEKDRLLLVLGFYDYLMYDDGINDGKRWNWP